MKECPIQIDQGRLGEQYRGWRILAAASFGSPCAASVRSVNAQTAPLGGRADGVESNRDLSLQMLANRLVSQTLRLASFAGRPEIIVPSGLRVRPHGLHRVGAPINKQPRVIFHRFRAWLSVSAPCSFPFCVSSSPVAPVSPPASASCLSCPAHRLRLRAICGQKYFLSNEPANLAKGLESH